MDVAYNIKADEAAVSVSGGTFSSAVPEEYLAAGHGNQKVETGYVVHECQWESVGEVTTEPTCTEKGVRTFACQVEGCDATKTEEIAIDPDAHDWSVAYEWTADNSSVTATHVCGNNAEHNETETGTVTSTTTATCTEAGITTYTATFTNSAFATQTKEVETAATGHDWSEWADADEATCDKAGSEKRTCNKCDAEETRDDADRPATGNHNWGEATYNWSPDHSSVTATRTCAGGHTETVNGTVTSETTAPTCEEDGYTVYTATFADTTLNTTVTVTDENSATGHSWGDWSYELTDGNSSMTATHTCADCGTTENPTSTNITSTATEPTCGTDGTTTYTANFGTHTGTVNVTIPATGAHTYVRVTDTEATTEAEGSWHEECRDCGATNGVTGIIERLPAPATPTPTPTTPAQGGTTTTPTPAPTATPTPSPVASESPEPEQTAEPSTQPSATPAPAPAANDVEVINEDDTPLANAPIEGVEDGGSGSWLWWGLGILLAAALITFFIIILLKRRKDEEEEEQTAKHL